ncbi:M14 family zinc carboxypeptidase [Undibacterium parvum]|uniref:Murein peptide amidase A n=1 Tax=Undibacterium parvum TaxID=401471 RepID=A0A3Q9BPE1_9BURK|nr:M14 family zinc carboxypeptidase [Undibacterium parvum]AZP11456.1 murein peptide amidase A [Undibacterium parvum]
MQWCEVSSKPIAVLQVAVLSISLTLPLQLFAVPVAALESKPVALTDWCATLVARLPKVSANECRATKLQASGSSSLNGFPILTKDVAADPGRKQALKVLLLGGIHGDEQTASSVVFKWLELQGKSNTQEFQWKVAPIVNPDGLLAAKPKRVNARGVDLNRNFPTPNWQQDAPKYWANTTRSDPRRYPGKMPISEPESLWVYDTIEKYRPDVIISVHAPFGVLDLDGPAKPPKSFGRLWYNRVGVYPGSLGNYSGLHKNIPVVTIELPNAVMMPPDAEVQRIWLDMQSWIRRNVPIRHKLAQPH